MASKASLARGHKLLKKMGRDGLLASHKRDSKDLYDMTVGHLFGDVWTRGKLSLRERQLITIAAGVALARPTGNHSHYHSALHIGSRRVRSAPPHSRSRFRRNRCAIC
mgnify:CR=1 FL=1